MTYIIVKNFAQVGYVIWYVISMGIIQTRQKPFFTPYVNFGRIYSTLSGNLFFLYNNIYKWQKITSKKVTLRKQNNTISKT